MEEDLRGTVAFIRAQVSRMTEVADFIDKALETGEYLLPEFDERYLEMTQMLMLQTEVDAKDMTNINVRLEIDDDGTTTFRGEQA